MRFIDEHAAHLLEELLVTVPLEAGRAACTTCPNLAGRDALAVLGSH